MPLQTDDFSRLDHDRLQQHIKLRSSTLEKQSGRSADKVDENVENELSIDKEEPPQPTMPGVGLLPASCGRLSAKVFEVIRQPTA